MPNSIFQMISILCGIYTGAEHTSCRKKMTMCIYGRKGPVEVVQPEVWKDALEFCANDAGSEHWRKKK